MITDNGEDDYRVISDDEPNELQQILEDLDSE